MIEIKTKVCSICNIDKDLSEFYSQNKKKANGEKYIYYHPDCKECSIKKSMQWVKDNPEKYRKNKMKYNYKLRDIAIAIEVLEKHNNENVI